MIEEVSLLKDYLYKLDRSTQNKIIFDDLMAMLKTKKSKKPRKQKPQIPEKKDDLSKEKLYEKKYPR